MLSSTSPSGRLTNTKKRCITSTNISEQSFFRPWFLFSKLQLHKFPRQWVVSWFSSSVIKGKPTTVGVPNSVSLFLKTSYTMFGNAFILLVCNEDSFFFVLASCSRNIKVYIIRASRSSVKGLCIILAKPAAKSLLHSAGILGKPYLAKSRNVLCISFFKTPYSVEVISFFIRLTTSLSATSIISTMDLSE